MNQLSLYDILLSAPHLTGQEWVLLQDSPPATLPALVGQFEQELCRATNARYALATHSGTEALELALWTLGVGPGDTVICPTLTFSATANAIDSVGAKPVFVGCEAITWGLDPDVLETALKTLQKRPKAIVIVDLYGMPAHWAALKTVANRYGIPLVADAAESLGSSLNGQACGTMGLLNAVSFNQNKIITGYSGGALLTEDSALLATARTISNQGRQLVPPYEQVIAGGNCRMNPITAGIGLVQLPVLTKRVNQRRAIFEQYYASINQYPGIFFQPERAGAVANRWLTAITIDPAKAGVSRDQLAGALKKEKIETRSVFVPLHQQQAWRECPFYGSSLADELAQTGLCLPSGSNLAEEEVERVIEAIKKQFGCHV